MTNIYIPFPTSFIHCLIYVPTYHQILYVCVIKQHWRVCVCVAMGYCYCSV